MSRFYQATFILSTLLFIWMDRFLYTNSDTHVGMSVYVLGLIALAYQWIAWFGPEFVLRQARKKDLTPAEQKKTEQGANLIRMGGGECCSALGFVCSALHNPWKVSIVFYAVGLLTILSYKPVSFHSKIE
jgi:hypothetical protein